MPSSPILPAAANRSQRIVLCYPVKAKHIAQIAAAAPHAEIVDAGQERVADELFAADIFCGHAKVPVPWDDIVRQGRLRWIQSSAAGLDHCLVPSVVASDIVVTSASGVLANQVADHTIALLTGLLRSLPTFFRAQQRREFIRRPTRDLHHTRIGIMGLGGNGRRLAEVLSAFQTTILATDWFPENKPACVAELLSADALDDILPRVDVLILAAPLNHLTRGIINSERLARLPRGAYLINMARGPMVVEDDLVAALDSGQLAGAGLDVTATEPLPSESPLWDQANVLITPHVGGQAATRIDDMTNFFCDNLARHSAGRPLRNLVIKELGFPRPQTDG
jgi:phosphoglycerate dehydrogenase-like enzyme